MFTFSREYNVLIRMLIENLQFCSKSIKFAGFLSIYTEKKVSYILNIAFEFGNILLVIKHLEEGYGNHSFISWRS